MIHFKFLEEVIPSITLDLAALRRGTQPYSMLLYQHQGTLFASADRIGNHDQELAKNQLNAFLQLLKDSNVDLGITPEYCVPWGSLDEVFSNPEKWPSEGKLWVLGMESIKPKEIKNVGDNFSKNGVQFVYDESIHLANKDFVDPLVYLFQAKVSGEDNLVALTQFKTSHMGVWSGGDIERDHLIEGKKIYVLRNNANSQHLLSVICSEAMTLPDNLTEENQSILHWSDIPYLILNPQVNPGPVHQNFIRFRNHVFRWDRKEIIGLNWNNSSKIGAKDLLKDGCGRSGIFLKSQEIKFSDFTRIKNNHALGMYYFFSGKHRHAYLLNSTAHAFLIDNLSVNINVGLPELQMRNGPEIRAAYFLKNDMSWEAPEKLSDGHLDFIADQKCKNLFLASTNNCVLEKERLVCITSGEIPEKSGSDWGEMDKLTAIRFEESTELNRRLTVAQDKDDESLKQRCGYLQAVGILDNIILKNQAKFPSSLARFRSKDLFVGYSQNRDLEGKIVQKEYYRYNIVSKDDELIKATICFITWGGRARAEKVYKALRGLFDSDNMNRARVVVYYQIAGEYFHVADPNPGSITTETGIGDDSIIR